MVDTVGMDVDKKPEESEQTKANGVVEGDEEPTAETIFIDNLNERVKIKVLKQTLKTLFKNYGRVLDVTAHRNVRMRGQAFVAMDSVEAAAKAVQEVKGFSLYGKPMRLAFAKTPSDAVVKRKRPDEFDAHKEERIKHKKETRRTNSYAVKMAQKKEALKKAAAAGAAGEEGPGARRIVQVTGEYLPPNKILFVQNLPDDATKHALETIFSQYDNFVEVRLIPSRKGIAFVQYLDETSSSVAKDALHNVKFGDADGGAKMKVTFARA